MLNNKLEIISTTKINENCVKNSTLCFLIYIYILVYLLFYFLIYDKRKTKSKSNFIFWVYLYNIELNEIFV